jgi:tryptophan 2,3-dioxygenase
MLFIIQHQVAELWMKLLIHELRAAIACLRATGQCDAEDPRPRQAGAAQLFAQWSVLETLTPSEYLEFRECSGRRRVSSRSSTARSNSCSATRTRRCSRCSTTTRRPGRIAATLEAPSLYDELLRLLARKGHAVPASLLERDVTPAAPASAALVPVFKRIYEDTEFWRGTICASTRRRRGDVPALAFPPHEAVERIIGFRRGTGGSSGRVLPAQALDLTFFPELIDVRTEIGVHPAAHRERAPRRCGLPTPAPRQGGPNHIRGFRMSTTNATTPPRRRSFRNARPPASVVDAVHDRVLGTLRVLRHPLGADAVHRGAVLRRQRRGRHRRAASTGPTLALVYAAAIFGGYVADRIIGYQRSILLGAAVMAVGLFMIAFPDEHVFKFGWPR